MRATAVFRHGEWIPTDIVAGHNGYPTRSFKPRASYFSSDTIRCEYTKRDLEMKSHADGKRYTSKSRYRAEVRARGMEEVGTDPAASRALPKFEVCEKDIRNDVERGWSEANFQSKTKFVWDRSVRRKVREAKGAGG